MSSAPKGHVCPPSNAIHPSDRWESLFIYSFICKFTNLRGKVEGLETPMDLENALLSREPNTLISAVLTRFILNLRPQTRNLSADQISATVASVLGDYFKTSERTVFWDDNLQMNVDPFLGLEGGFFAAEWDFKLKILRQLVELQLTHCADIKNKIDRAWGVQQNKNKKKDVTTARPDPSDPDSQEHLQLLPLGQDSERKRYWVADNSPRIYVSTNPWKITATFQSISSTREQYVETIEKLKNNISSSTEKKGRGKKQSKQEASHLVLIASLESRLELIDAEIARVAKVRRKIEQRKILMEQAELRQTRTRRQTRKPDYVYGNAFESEDDGGEYTYQEDEGNDDDFGEAEFYEDGMGPRRSSRRNNDSLSIGKRRSARTTVLNANSKRDAAAEQESWSSWRGERRSARLGAPPEVQLGYEPPPKRARTDDSALSTNSSDPDPGIRNGVGGVAVKASGAAALKPTEIALEQIAGRKKSKYWVYAVEPIPGAVVPRPADSDVKLSMDDDATQQPSTNDEISPDIKPLIDDAAMDVDNGSLDHSQNGHISRGHNTESESVSELDRTLAGSLSPLSP